MARGDRSRGDGVRKRILLLLLVVLVATAGSVVVAAMASDDAPQVSGDGPESNGTNTASDAPGASADESLPSVAENDSVGRAVSWVGDVDGDGAEDLLVGAPGTDAGGKENAGVAYLFYGPVDPGDVDPADANVTFLGASAGDRAGHAVAGAGDLDGDGHADLVVGAPLHDGGGSDAGTAYVVYGGDSLAAERNLSSAAVRLDGTDSARAGWAVAPANDSVGTRAGVLVGAPGWGAKAENAGAAFLVSNATLANATSMSLADGADARLVGTDGAHAGWAVSPAGDVNGDGTGDVLVGARTADATDANATGAAYVVTGPVSGERALDDAALRLHGASDTDSAGYAVADVGDVNDDGFADVLVGAPYADGAGENAGAAYVVFGAADLASDRSLGDANVTVAGVAAGDHLGRAVGASDASCGALAVGAPGADGPAEDAGAAYVLAANASLDGTMSVGNATVTGESADARVGTAVALGNGSEASASALAVGAPGTETDDGPLGRAVVRSVPCPDDAATDEAAAAAALADVADEGPEADGAGDASAAEDSRVGVSTDEPTETTGADAETATAGDDTAADASGDDGTPQPGDASAEPAGDASTDDGAGVDESAGTATATSTPTATPEGDSENAAGAADLASIDATVTCEDPDHYVYNPNGEPVEVTVSGPDGTETFTVAGGDSHGGPTSPSHTSPSLPPGEYTVTAEGPDGGTVPVNGESSYATTIKECPTTTLSTECVDGQTVRVSVRAEHLTGRHAATVDIEVQSPIEEDRQTITAEPSDGVVTRTFEVGDLQTSTIWVELQGVSPALLATDTVDEGVCYDDVSAGAEPDDPAAASDDESADASGASIQTVTDTEASTDTGASTDDGESTTEIETEETESQPRESTPETDDPTGTEGATGATNETDS